MKLQQSRVTYWSRFIQLQLLKFSTNFDKGDWSSCLKLLEQAIA